LSLLRIVFSSLDIISLIYINIFTTIICGGLIPKGRTNNKAKESSEPYYTPKPEYVFINTPQDVYREVKEEMFEDKETFIALFLNTKNRVIKKEIISFGSPRGGLKGGVFEN
jgi:hypothetical protein